MKFPFIVVLDINNTLLSKIKREDKDTLDKLDNSLLFGIHHYFLLKRSFTDLFIRFLESHDLKYVIWSTALKKNIKKMAVYLEDLGYKFDGFFGQEDCEEGEYPGMKTKKHVKNLEIVSKEFKTPLENCILVDDSYQKSVKGQNFLKIKEIDLFQEDEELIRIGFEIDKFIKCKKDCEIKKKWFEVNTIGGNEEWEYEGVKDR